MGHPKKPEIDLKKLVNTPYDLLLEEFPYWTRSHLSRLKKAELRKLAFDERMKLDADRRDDASYREKYKIATDRYLELKSTVDDAFKLKDPIRTFKIEPREKSGVGEATPVIVASDFHIEEKVEPGQVNGLNKFTLEIADQRSTEFFQNSLKLIKMVEGNVKINTVILALLGDFLSGSIHDELIESNQLLPGDAIWKVQNILISGIDFFLKNTSYNFVIPCAPGNHSRMTKQQRHGTEQGNSLETYMYKNIANYYRNEKRLKFIISEGYHTYVDVYGYTIRFHHGHAIKYGGGVGGIYISVNKAIAQWNRAQRADWDIFGHFHQFVDGGNFVCNGSLIGYNAYALSIKATFEQPKQAMIIIDKKRGKTIVAPITFSV